MGLFTLRQLLNWRGLPSLDLFRSYYFCRITSPQTSALGSCLTKKRSTEFINVPQRPTGCQRWKSHWLYIQDGSSLKDTCVPEAPAVKRPSWDAATLPWTRVRERVAELQRSGLSGPKVMLDALKNSHHTTSSRWSAPSLRVDTDMHICPRTPINSILLHAEADHIMPCMEHLFGQKATALATMFPTGHGRRRGGRPRGGRRGWRRPRSIVLAGYPGGQGDDVAGSAVAPHVVLPQSLEPAEVVGGKRPLTTLPQSLKAPRLVSTVATDVCGPRQSCSLSISSVSVLSLSARLHSFSSPISNISRAPLYVTPAPMCATVGLDHPEPSQPGLAVDVGDAGHHHFQPRYRHRAPGQ